MSEPTLKAWHVIVADVSGVVIALSAGQAKRAMLLDARAHGYDVDWLDMRCLRAPLCDSLAGTLEPNTVYAIADEA